MNKHHGSDFDQSLLDPEYVKFLMKRVESLEAALRFYANIRHIEEWEYNGRGRRAQEALKSE